IAQLGFLMLFLGLVVFVAALDAGAGPEIVTWPMLLARLGIGALASRRGRPRDRALADAPRRPRDRRARVAARRGHGVVGARRAERRGRRAAEHVLGPRG